MSESLFDDDARQSWAEISPCGRYRYRLGRAWGPAPRTMMFVMLNPSTADAYEDDPTIRRCVSFAKREGCTGIDVVNLSSAAPLVPYAEGIV